MCFLLPDVFCFFLFKQKTADEMRISDWSSDVCSSDLGTRGAGGTGTRRVRGAAAAQRAVAVALPLRPDGVAVALAYLRRAATDAEGLTTALDLRHERT